MKNLFLFILLFITLSGTAQTDYFVKANTELENKEELRLTEEEQFLKSNFPFIKISDWSPGMRFTIVPNYIMDDNRLMIYPVIDNIYTSTGIKQNDFVGKIFTLKDVVEMRVDDYKGNSMRIRLIFQSDNSEYYYEIVGTRDSLRKSKVSSDFIFGMAYLNEIDTARSTLIGKKVYMLKKEWLKESEKNIKGEVVEMKKLVPVTITNIGISNVYGCVKVVFKYNNSEFFVNVRLSGINSESGYIRNGSGWNAEWYLFEDIFKFKNPKTSYPNISAQHWQLIQQSRVVRGMSKEACLLSWGKPNDVNKTTGSYGVHEQWVYYGNYLYFENGKLTTIQD